MKVRCRGLEAMLKLQDSGREGGRNRLSREVGARGEKQNSKVSGEVGTGQNEQQASLPPHESEVFTSVDGRRDQNQK